MSSDLYLDDVLRERWDDVARILTTFDAQGRQVSARPYSAAEGARADADAVATAEQANRITVQQRAAAALDANAAFLSLTSPTNAQTLAQVQRLTKECSALIRLALNALNTTTGT